MSKPQAELILTGQYLLTLDPEQTVIEEGGLAIAGDTIVAVGKGSALRANFPGALVLAEPHGLIMPGLINVHTHAAMSLFRGLADDVVALRDDQVRDHLDVRYVSVCRRCGPRGGAIRDAGLAG